jgi:hypothetical protein
VRLGADEQVGVARARDVAQHVRNAPGGQLARSAGAGRVIDQTFLAAKEEHGVLSEQSGQWCVMGDYAPLTTFRDKDRRRITFSCRRVR